MSDLPDEKCERCGKAGRVLIGMEPGKDGAAWSLCTRCWIEGGVKKPEPTMEEVKPPKEVRPRQRSKGPRQSN